MKRNISRMNQGHRPHLENAYAFDLRAMRREFGCLTDKGMTGIWQWVRGEKIASVRFLWVTGHDTGKLILSYSVGGKPHETEVQLVSMPLKFGGRRWWMLCPVSGKRARKLHLFNGLTRFVHRDAVSPRPTYASQRVGGRSRIMQQRWMLRRRIGDEESNLVGPPCRPRGMHRVTFERLEERDRELARRDPIWGWLGALD